MVHKKIDLCMLTFTLIEGWHLGWVKERVFSDYKIKEVHRSVLTGSKLTWGVKIARESKFREPEKSCFFRDQNHNFEKLKGPKCN